MQVPFGLTYAIELHNKNVSSSRMQKSWDCFFKLQLSKILQERSSRSTALCTVHPELYHFYFCHSRKTSIQPAPGVSPGNRVATETEPFGSQTCRKWCWGWNGIIMGCLFCWRCWLAACQGSEEHSAAATCARSPAVWNVCTQCAQAPVHST